MFLVATVKDLSGKFEFPLVTYMSIIRVKLRIMHFTTLKRYKPPLNVLRCFCIKGPHNEPITPVELAHATYEMKSDTKNAAPVLVAHGYLASKRNWVSTCKRLLGATKPQRKIFAVDLRNHGDSPHTDQHSNWHTVEDMRHFIESFQLKQVAALGHSYGGLACMLLALLHPDLVERLIIVDVAPKDQSKNMQHVYDALDAIEKVTVPPKIPMSMARSLIDQQLVPSVPEKEYRSFLLTQLIQKEDGNISWRFNVTVLKKYVMKTGSFPEIRGKIYDKPAAFIAGAKSNFLRKRDEPDVKTYFPQAEFHYIADAGHVVHADQPEQFLQICSEFLNKPN